MLEPMEFSGTRPGFCKFNFHEIFDRHENTNSTKSASHPALAMQVQLFQSLEIL